MRGRVLLPEAVGKLRRSIYAQKILLDFVNLKINNAGQRYREEAIEKTILRILAPCVFSHSLAPFLSLLGAVPEGSAGWKAGHPVLSVCRRRLSSI